MADMTAKNRAEIVQGKIFNLSVHQQCVDVIAQAIRAAERAAYELATEAAQDAAPEIHEGDYYGKFLDTVRADMATDIIDAIRKLPDG